MVELNDRDRIILALLFASDEPLSIKRIAGVLVDLQHAEINDALDRIKDKIDRDGMSFKLEQVAGGYQLATRPEYAGYIAKLYTGRRKQRLSRAGLETLAIIAYKQPITRAEIEQMRGVSCGGVISTLLERSLIRITGKAKVLGAPFLYGTTREFLEYLGLNSLKDLPSMEELESLLASREDGGKAGETSGVQEPALESGPHLEVQPDREEVVNDEDEENRAEPESAPNPADIDFPEHD